MSDNRSTRSDELDEGLSVSRWTSEYRLIKFFKNCLDLCLLLVEEAVLKNEFLVSLSIFANLIANLIDESFG